MYTQPEPTTALLGGSPAPNDLFNFWDVTGGYMKQVSTATLTSVFGSGGSGGSSLQISNCGAFLVPPTPTSLDFCDGLSVSYISAGEARAVITDNGVTNVKLAQMAANTVKVNNTTNPANATDIAMAQNTVLVRSGGNIEAMAMGINTVLGRAGNTNIAPLPIQDVLTGIAALTSGTATINNPLISVASICFATPSAALGDVIIRVGTVSNGSVVFNTSGSPSGNFNYLIFII